MSTSAKVKEIKTLLAVAQETLVDLDSDADTYIHDVFVEMSLWIEKRSEKRTYKANFLLIRTSSGR